MKVLVCGFAVVIAGGKRSVSFSNLVAKPCGVDGTASWWVWESRWLPQFFCEWGSPSVGARAFFVPPQGGGLRACGGVFWGLHKKPEHFCCSVLEPYYALGSPSRLLTGCISKKYSPYGTSGAHSPSL